MSKEYNKIYNGENLIFERYVGGSGGGGGDCDVELPSGIKHIELNDFGMPTKITIDMETIGDMAYMNANSLTDVVLTDNVIEIGDNAFYNTENLSSITLGDNVMKIGSNAFYNAKFNSISFPNELKEIGDQAFYWSNLTSVTITNQVDYIGSSAFASSQQLKEITFNKMPSGCAYLCQGCYNLTSVTLPNYMLEIAQSMFESCTNLQRIELPDSIRTIQYGAFSNCYSLEMPRLPMDLQDIGYNAFYWITMRGDFVIPDNVRTIGGYAFYNNEFDSLTIGISIEEIQDYAFRVNNDIGYKFIEIHAINPPTIGAYTFYNSGDCPIYVPDEAVDSYKSASNWNQYQNRIFPMSQKP